MSDTSIVPDGNDDDTAASLDESLILIIPKSQHSCQSSDCYMRHFVSSNLGLVGFSFCFEQNSHLKLFTEFISTSALIFHFNIQFEIKI